MQPLNLKLRQPAPGFTLTDDRGVIFTLSDYRIGQRNLLLLMLHGPGCPDCARLAAEAAEHRAAWESWGTALLVLHAEAAGFPGLPFRQAQDLEGRLRALYGGPATDVALAALDGRGVLLDGWSLRHPEPLDWREVAETTRWIAVQEPECGTCVIAPGWE